MSRLRKKVYEKLRKVPKGKFITYKKLAEAVNSKAYRAVGTFMKTNIFPKKIPCYKVVKSNGFVGGYSGGMKKKIALLKKDGIKVKNNKVDLEKYQFEFS